MGGNLEPHAFFKPHRPKNSTGIFNETEVMEYLDRLLFKVVLAVEEIYQGAELFLVELDSHGVDGEIPAE
jgi:hypothetical protein